MNRLLGQAMLSGLGVAVWLAAAHAIAGDVVGKVVTGYQGWLSAPGDGSSVNKWKHTNLECWPDVREYATTFSGCPFKQAGITQPGYTGNLGNGSPATIFSSWNDQTINKHFEWMRQYGGIDCVALQRFGSELGNAQLKEWKNGVAAKVRTAAETYGRKYYIMYDISGWTNFQSEIKSDWTALKGSHLNSPAYAMEAGMPVVCVWGMGFSDRPGNAQSWKDVVAWFKAQGCYVIGGLRQGFQSDSGSYTDPVTQVVTTNQAAYKMCDMVMVWVVGKSSGFATLYGDGLAWCNANGKAYQADVYPGTAFYNTDFATDPTATKNKRPRMHGDLMWSQFAAARSKGIKNIYISMFDELQEATQIFKTAEDSTMIPDGRYFLTLDADGVACSADFYLRLTKDGSDMVKGITPYVTAHPTEHIVGGNPTSNLVLNPSFEMGGTAPTSWARGGSAVGSTASAQDGAYALKIATAGINNPTTQTIAIQIGKTYNISVWINASGVTSGNAVFDTSDKYDGAGQGQFVMRSANSGWMKYSGSFTATTPSVTLRMFTESGFAGTVYFDDIVLTEKPPNTPPVATPQSMTTPENAAKLITLGGSDEDGDLLSYAIVTAPVHGTLTGTAPDLTYTPASGFTGADSFTFTVHDGTVSSTAAVVAIDVTPVLTFSAWIDGFYQGSLDPAVTGFQADPDHDGIANGLEFVLGGDPARNDAAAIMPSGTRAGDNFIFTYQRSESTTDNSPQIVQYGNNLGEWTDVTISAASGFSGGATYTVTEGSPAPAPKTIVVTIPHGGAGGLFARLKVIEPLGE